MSTAIDHIETLVSKAGELAETKVELWKLKAVDKTSATVTSLISAIAVVLCIAVAVIIISFGVAVWIGNSLGQLSSGFFIVGGFYVLAAVVVYIFRKPLIKTPLSNIIADKIVK